MMESTIPVYVVLGDCKGSDGNVQTIELAKFFTEADARAHMQHDGRFPRYGRGQQMWTNIRVAVIDETLAVQHPAHHEHIVSMYPAHRDALDVIRNELNARPDHVALNIHYGPL